MDQAVPKRHGRRRSRPHRCSTLLHARACRPRRSGSPRSPLATSTVTASPISGRSPVWPTARAFGRATARGNWTDASNGLPRETFCGGGMAFGDVNKDGKMDVAIADHCKGVFVYLGDGAGNWRNASAGLPTIGSEDVAVGDFNNDGCLDLASWRPPKRACAPSSATARACGRRAPTGWRSSEWGNSIVAGRRERRRQPRRRRRLLRRSARVARRREGRTGARRPRACRRPRSTASTGASRSAT